MNAIDEEAALADIITKLSNLTTPSKAFLARKLLNSARTESIPQYMAELYEPNRIIAALNTLYSPPISQTTSTISNNNPLAPQPNNQIVSTISNNSTPVNANNASNSDKTPKKYEKYSKELKEEAVGLSNKYNNNNYAATLINEKHGTNIDESTIRRWRLANTSEKDLKLSKRRKQVRKVNAKHPDHDNGESKATL